MLNNKRFMDFILGFDDYNPYISNARIAAGETNTTLYITIYDDNILENNETFYVTISNFDSGNCSGQSIVNIIEDEGKLFNRYT